MPITPTAYGGLEKRERRERREGGEGEGGRRRRTRRWRSEEKKEEEEVQTFLISSSSCSLLENENETMHDLM